MIKEAPEGLIFLICVYPNGRDTQPKLEYRQKTYEIEEGMITVLNPKTRMPVSWPNGICSVDWVKE